MNATKGETVELVQQELSNWWSYPGGVEAGSLEFFKISPTWIGIFFSISMFLDLNLKILFNFNNLWFESQRSSISILTLSTILVSVFQVELKPWWLICSSSHQYFPATSTGVAVASLVFRFNIQVLMFILDSFWLIDIKLTMSGYVS